MYNAAAETSANGTIEIDVQGPGHMLYRYNTEPFTHSTFKELMPET